MMGNDMVVTHIADQINAIASNFIDIEKDIPGGVVVLGKRGIIHIFPKSREPLWCLRMSTKSINCWLTSGRNNTVIFRAP